MKYGSQIKRKEFTTPLPQQSKALSHRVFCVQALETGQANKEAKSYPENETLGASGRTKFLDLNPRK